MSEENKIIARRWSDELWSNGNLSVADEIIDANYVNHDVSSPDLGRGPEGEKKRVALYRTAFPDLRFNVEDLFSDNDKVVTRWTCRGTHKGDLSGVPPTGKAFNITGITIARFAGGKGVECWVNWDALGLFQQLGIVPEFTKTKRAAA
jgi:steroid delta-isomerase-like uncharacterized protein